MIYANHAGTSWPKPPDVHAAINEALALDPTAGATLFEASRAEVCRFLGIADPDRFLFTTGCTAALSVALSDLPWEAGDVVVTSSLEHHALIRPLELLAEHRGVRLLSAPYLPGSPIDFDFVRDALRGGNVRWVATTHASNVTGELLPVRDLAELAHEHGARFLLDAAQSVGIVPVDVSQIGADLLVLAGHKGPLGPQGVGGFWATPDVEFRSVAAACSIGEQRERKRGCAGFPGYCDVGSVNLAGAAGLGAGLRWIRERGLDATGGHARRLAAGLIAAIESMDGCRVLGDPTADRTGAVSAEVRRLPVERAEEFFAARGIVVRAGAHCAPRALDAIDQPKGTIRISFGASNTPADVDAVVDALHEAARA